MIKSGLLSRNRVPRTKVNELILRRINADICRDYPSMYQSVFSEGFSREVSDLIRQFLQSDELATAFIKESYLTFLGRPAFASEIPHYLTCCQQSDPECRIKIASSIECYENFGADPRMYISILWRHLSGSSWLPSLDDSVDRLAAGDLDIETLARKLFASPVAVNFQSSRFWTRFTGMLDAPPEEITASVRTLDRRSCITAICSRPEYLDSIETDESGLAIAARNLARSVRTRLYGLAPSTADVLTDQEALLKCSSDAQVRGWMLDVLDSFPARARLYSTIASVVDAHPSSQESFIANPHYYALLDDKDIPPSGTTRVLSDVSPQQARLLCSRLSEALALPLKELERWSERLRTMGNVPTLVCEMLYEHCNAKAFSSAVCQSMQIELNDPPGHLFSRNLSSAIDDRTVGEPTIVSTYFYWYDRVNAQKLIENPDNAVGFDGEDALTHRPPPRRFLTSANQGLHEDEFLDMAAAGVDIALLVYFGSPYSGPQHARTPFEEENSQHIGLFSDAFLPKIIEARERCLREGSRPPKLGLFFDTTSLFVNAKKWHVVGNTSAGKAWFYETLRNFFSQVPRHHWGCLDQRPLIFIYHQSNFRSPVGDIFSNASARFMKDFGVAPFFVAAAEQDSVKVCHPSAIDEWLPFMREGRSLDMLASLLSSKEAISSLPDRNWNLFEQFEHWRSTQNLSFAISEGELLDEVAACVCLFEKVWQRVPDLQEISSFLRAVTKIGRTTHVRAWLQTREGLCGLNAYLMHVCLRSDLPLGQLFDHSVVQQASAVSEATGDLIDGYIEIFASDTVYQAAGGQDAFFLDYFYRHTTHLLAPHGSRAADLEDLARLGRHEFVKDRMQTEAVMRGIISHWMWYFLGRGYAGRGDSDFYWTGAIDPMFYGVASVGPGYDQSRIRTRPARIADRAGGRRYHAVWQNLLSMEPRPWLVHLESWNEFFEGTDICESREFGRLFIDLTRHYADRLHDSVSWSRAEISEPDIQRLPKNITSDTVTPDLGDDAMHDSLRAEFHELASEVRSLAKIVRGSHAVAGGPQDTSLEIYPHSMVAHGLVFEPEVYRSYFDQDIGLLESFVDRSIRARPGCFVDFLGRVTKCHFLPSISHLEGKASTALPVPGDGFYAETIEYIALLQAVATAPTSRFVAAEFGAGWGPWIAAAGVAARSRSKRDVHLIGVEASAGKIEFMKEHLVDNGLRPATTTNINVLDGVHTTCVCAAVWVDDGKIQFPDIDAANEYGAAVSKGSVTKDYRGVEVRSVDVPCFTIETLLEPYDIVDFIHIDIQGAEDLVCGRSIEFLKERARYIFVATHSRRIEGNLIELFRKDGFELVREKPCRFHPEASWSGALEGLTTADGGQIWRNPKLS